MIPVTNVDVVKTRIVWLGESSENRVTTQKYESFACDTIMDPAPMAKVASRRPVFALQMDCSQHGRDDGGRRHHGHRR